MDKHLVALYELKRQTFLIGYIQNPNLFSASLAYAYLNRVAPVLNELVQRESYESDPYKDIYSVNARFVNDLLDYIADRSENNNFEDIGFYKLEQTFDARADRVKLKHALEYARINGLFDEVVWKAVVSDAPLEANRLASTFNPKDVHFD